MMKRLLQVIILCNTILAQSGRQGEEVEVNASSFQDLSSLDEQSFVKTLSTHQELPTVETHLCFSLLTTSSCQ